MRVTTMHGGRPGMTIWVAKLSHQAPVLPGRTKNRRAVLHLCLPSRFKLGFADESDSTLFSSNRPVHSPEQHSFERHANKLEIRPCNREINAAARPFAMFIAHLLSFFLVSDYENIRLRERSVYEKMRCPKPRQHAPDPPPHPYLTNALAFHRLLCTSELRFQNVRLTIATC